jgi:site-specific DNA recombinase
MELHKIRTLLNNGSSIYNLPLRVVYYARVSTDKDAQINSLNNKIMYFEKYIKDNLNWTFCGGYIDEAISAVKTTGRENFLRMIEDGKEDKFDFIITKEISRFSRSTLDSIYYTQELLLHGVGVLFQSDNINTLMPDAELRLTIMASIAQEEIRKLSERTKFGFKRSIEKGRVLGKDNILGYDKHDGKLTINEKEAEIIRLIFNLYVNEKLGTRAIGFELERRGILNANNSRFACSTITNIIRNPKYKGYYCGNKTSIVDYRQKKKIKLDTSEWVIYKDNNIPIIIDEKTWDQANLLLEQRSEKSKNHETGYQSRYSYSGKIFCAEHNTSFHRDIYKSKKHGNREIWQCKMYRVQGKKGCESPTILTSELDDIMIKINNILLLNKDNILNNVSNAYKSVLDNQNYKNDILKKQNTLTKIQQKKDKLFDLITDGLIEKKEFSIRNNSLIAEFNKIEAEIIKLQDEEKNLKKLEIYYNDLYQDLKRTWESNLTATNILLDKIIVHKTKDKNTIGLEIQLKTPNKFTALIFREDKKSNNLISLQSMKIYTSEMIQNYSRPYSGDKTKKTYQFTYKIKLNINH